jgi:hypothetical protein
MIGLQCRKRYAACLVGALLVIVTLAFVVLAHAIANIEVVA